MYIAFSRYYNGKLVPISCQLHVFGYLLNYFLHFIAKMMSIVLRKIINGSGSFVLKVRLTGVGL